MTPWLPAAGDMCEALFPFEVLSVDSAGAEAVITASAILAEGEVFLIITSNEVGEIPAWEFDIMHKSSIYYFNIPAGRSMIHLDGEGGQYSFPFKRLDRSTTDS